MDMEKLLLLPRPSSFEDVLFVYIIKLIVAKHKHPHKSRGNRRTIQSVGCCCCYEGHGIYFPEPRPFAICISFIAPFPCLPTRVLISIIEDVWWGNVCANNTIDTVVNYMEKETKGHCMVWWRWWAFVSSHFIFLYMWHRKAQRNQSKRDRI